MAQRLRNWTKALRATPAINAPLTYGVRAILNALGRPSEAAVKHLPHVGLTRLELPGGRRARMWSNGDDWVSNQVFWRGWDGYEPEVTPLFWNLARSSEVTLDIGAHVGYYAILAALANPASTVYAFEPLPVVFERLERNVSLNDLRNVVATRCAVGSVDGTAEFFHVPGVVPCSSSLSEDFMQANRHVVSLQVDVTRVDTFASRAGIERVDLMKLDTETTECDVLSGMGDLLAQWRPSIVCEVLPQTDGRALTELLRPLGYRFHLLTADGPVARTEIVGEPRWLNYLFEPAS